MPELRWSRSAPAELAPRRAAEPRGIAPLRARSVAAVHGDDAGAAEAEVVLERDLGAFDLARLGLAAQVPDELGALREAGRAEGWPLDRRSPEGLVTNLPP